MRATRGEDVERQQGQGMVAPWAEGIGEVVNNAGGKRGKPRVNRAEGAII